MLELSSTRNSPKDGYINYYSMFIYGVIFVMKIIFIFFYFVGLCIRQLIFVGTRYLCDRVASMSFSYYLLYLEVKF